MSLTSEDVDAIRQLLEIVTENRLSELSVTLRDGLSLSIKCDAAQSPPPAPVYYSAPPAVVSQPAPAQLSAAPALSAPKSAARGAAAQSPMVGIFYRSASPDDPPYVKVGDAVQVGQIIGLIEAMKVFSEIPSEVAGRVTEVVVDNGKLVQLGQPLLYLEPL